MKSLVMEGLFWVVPLEEGALTAEFSLNGHHCHMEQRLAVQTKTLKQWEVFRRLRLLSLKVCLRIRQ